MQIPETQQNIRKIFFDFEIIAFEFLHQTLAFTEREYFSSGVNILTNSLKVADTTKMEFLEMIFSQSDQKI